MNPKKTAIKAVTFDLWETLIFERDGANKKRTDSRCKHLSEALQKLGVNLEPTQIAVAIDETIDTLLKIWDTNKDVSHVDQLQLIIKHATKNTVTLKPEWINKLTQAYIEPIFEVPPYLNPDVPTVLQQLRNQNKHIGLICNTGLTPGIGLRKFLQKQGMAQYFDTMLFTDEVRIRKPAPEIFHQAAHELKTKPEETVHIGDNMRTDIWGAKNAGFKAIHFVSQDGRDQKAWTDPKSLASRSRNIGQLQNNQTPLPPDKTITSLATLLQAIEELNR